MDIEHNKINADNYKKKDIEELRKLLSPIEYSVTMEDGTESPYTGKYWDSFEEGIYVDITTGEPLFSSKDKFKSNCGWPSFAKPVGNAILQGYLSSYGKN